MIKFISSALRSTRSWRKLEPRYSQLAKGDVPKVYQDWEYCQMIANQLKNNNTKQALNLLFQSYLNNKILNIPIYHQIYGKLYSESLHLSYAQIVYIIYREHFPPHPLMTGWMNDLTYSQNKELLSKIKQDYQILGEPYPQHIQHKKEKKEKTIKIVQDPKKSQTNKLPQKIESLSIKSSDISENNGSRMQQGLSPQQLFRTKLTSQVREILSQLSIDISDFTRVVVHNVQVQFDNSQINNQQDLPSDQQYQFQQGDMQALGLYGLDINKIKIGKIQFINDKPKI